VKTVHIILNAHLDPVWLWSWRDGLDEVLNTSYYLCNLLDRHPDIVYTRGEAWLYEQIRTADPALFRRIAGHVKTGRWSLVGGWYTQPDCNLPSGFAFQRQIGLGKKWFRKWFGMFPKIAYNVDSFGHAATLPGYMREAGQSYYVMMRPQEHEMALPARLFRWRGYVKGPEVTTFRIAKAYCTPEGLTEDHIQAAASELPEGVNHTMCFVGVGDHGGGPTEGMIEWCRAHRDSFPGLRLVFSSPDKFFQAIRPEVARLPLVVGELQQHAIGCYTVHRPVKVALRRTEHRLAQAEIALKGRTVSVDERRELQTAWNRVCFHHFHDTLGGTCLPSAYLDVEAQLGQALAIGDEVATFALRRKVIALPDEPSQRFVLFNASEFAFNDYFEIEPWLEWTPWKAAWRIVDEKGRTVPYQVIAAESAGAQESRLLFSVAAAPEELRVLRIIEGPAQVEKTRATLTTGPTLLAVNEGPALDLGTPASLRLPGIPSLPLPSLALYDDPSDTWSHGIDRYPQKNRRVSTWEQPRLLDQGPLMGSLIQVGTIGGSKVQAEWRLYQGKPWSELLLRVLWTEEWRVLKLEWEFPQEIVGREDGILGGSLDRPLDGRELPLRDWTALRWKQGGVAVIAPDVFAAGCGPNRLGLTLLRSCVMACHDPNPGTHPRASFSDRGEHFFRFRFLALGKRTPADLDAIAYAQQRPLLSSTTTRGMKSRSLKGKYAP
jgi:alpha-mannosidase